MQPRAPAADFAGDFVTSASSAHAMSWPGIVCRGDQHLHLEALAAAAFAAE
jgi:hypothetical protein